MKFSSTWHSVHQSNLSRGQRLADKIANVMGSWQFIIWQTIFVLCWMGLNVLGIIRHWDAYPFILLNLIFSTQAAYAAPIIMMAQNRQADRDRVQAQADYNTNIEAKKEIEALQIQLTLLETEKLDKILQILNNQQNNKD